MRHIINLIKIMSVLCIVFASVIPSKAQDEVIESVMTESMVETVPEVVYQEPIIEEIVPDYTESIEEVPVESEIVETIESVEDESTIEEDILDESSTEVIQPILNIDNKIDDNTLFIKGTANPGASIRLLKDNVVVAADNADNSGNFELELRESVLAGNVLVIESYVKGEKVASINETVYQLGVNLTQPLYDASINVVGVTSPNRKIELVDSQNMVIATSYSDLNGLLILTPPQTLEVGTTVKLRVYDQDRIATAKEITVELDPSVVINQPNITTKIDNETVYIEGTAQPNIEIQLMDANGNVIESAKSTDEGSFSIQLEEPLDVGEMFEFKATDGWRTSESVQARVDAVEIEETGEEPSKDESTEEKTPEDEAQDVFNGLFEIGVPIHQQIADLNEEEIQLLLEKINQNRTDFENLLIKQSVEQETTEDRSVNDVVMTLVDQLIDLKKEDEQFVLEDFLLNNDSLLSSLNEEERKMFFSEQLQNDTTPSEVEDVKEEALFIRLNHEVYENTTELTGETNIGAMVTLTDEEGNEIQTVEADELGIFRIELNEELEGIDTAILTTELNSKETKLTFSINKRPRVMIQTMSLMAPQATLMSVSNENIRINDIYDTSTIISGSVVIDENSGFIEWLLRLLGLRSKEYVVRVVNEKNEIIGNEKRVATSDGVYPFEFKLNQPLPANSKVTVILSLKGWGWLSGNITREINRLDQIVIGTQFGFSTTPPRNITFETTEITNAPNKIIPRVAGNHISVSVTDTRANGSWNLTVRADQMTHTQSGHQLENALYFKDGVSGEEQLIENTSVSVANKSSNETSTEMNKSWGQNEGIVLKTNPIQAMPGEYESTITWTLTDAP